MCVDTFRYEFGDVQEFFKMKSVCEHLNCSVHLTVRITSPNNIGIEIRFLHRLRLVLIYRGHVLAKLVKINNCNTFNKAKSVLIRRNRINKPYHLGPTVLRTALHMHIQKEAHLQNMHFL